MNYILLPSLEHIALVKIAITLWNQDNIGAFMPKYYLPLLGREEWKKLEDKVKEKLLQLPLPESLKKEILVFIQPIGLEIFSWMQFHKNYYNKGIELPNELCWTQQATVDYKQTAKALIRDHSVDITIRYKLACIYCLENDIRELWNSMPQIEKGDIYNEGHRKFSTENMLVVFWTYVIKGEVAKFHGLLKKSRLKEMSPYQFAFGYAASNGNKPATEYFLQKLTPREREESLETSAVYVAKRRCTPKERYESKGLPKQHFADILCLLLSKMEEEQQTKVFKSYPYEVLQYLLVWPWQSLFMETANGMWNFLSEEDYYRLFETIIDKVRDGEKDCNYQKLLGEFWQQSPDAHKRYVINEYAWLYKRASKHLLSRLLEIEDKKNIKLILKDATLIVKGTYFFYDILRGICKDLIYGDEWDLLEFFIRECVSSKDEMIEFKKHMNSRMYNSEKERYKFLLLLDNFIKGYDTKKRTMEEDERSAAKRLHSKEFEEV